MDSHAHRQREEFRRTELINGQLYLMAPAALNHNIAAGSLYAIFRNHFRKSVCMALSDGTKVFFSDEEHLIPDVMIVCDRSKLKRDGVHGSPDLVVEVLSPSTEKNDKGHKRDVYEMSGVREYWLVDPETRRIEQYFLKDSRYHLHEIYRLEDDIKDLPEEERQILESTIRSVLFPDLEIPLNEIFEDFVE